MRKRLLIGLLAGALTVATSGAVAADTEGKSTGNVEGGWLRFVAKGDESGGTGWMRTDYGYPDGTRGVVDCYHQVGNAAWFSGEITSGYIADEKYFLVAVEDNGEPGWAGTPDYYLVFFSAAPWDCTSDTPPADLGAPVSKGNIQVHR